MSSSSIGHAKKPYKYIVSACLAGVSCTYKGGNKLHLQIKHLVDEGLAIPACPEVMGGLPIPRENSEIVGGDGADVLKKAASVLTSSGIDISKNYTRGARKILSLAKKHKINKAILKSNSPACGYGRIYDGTFRKVLKKGNGVLAELLRQNGIRVITEKGYVHAK